MTRRKTKLDPVTNIPAYAVIIRAIHERGPAQNEAMAELRRRGLWLSEDQKRMAEAEGLKIEDRRAEVQS